MRSVNAWVAPGKEQMALNQWFLLQRGREGSGLKKRITHPDNLWVHDSLVFVYR